MTRQSPLPGIGGVARFGRRAAISSKTPPTASEGHLPLGWKTIIDPADVLLHLSITGEPQTKERPRMAARLVGTGMVVKGKATSGDVRITRSVYTPPHTETAEEALRWIFRNHRRGAAPTPEPVGILCLFKTTSSRGDGDNFFKLLADSMCGTLLVDDQQISEHHVHLLRSCTVPGTELLVWSTRRRYPGT